MSTPSATRRQRRSFSHEFKAAAGRVQCDGVRSQSFEKRAITITTEVRQVVTALVTSPGCGPTATEIQRATGLNLKLSWKLARIVAAGSTLSEAIYIPGAGNQKPSTFRAQGTRRL